MSLTESVPHGQTIEPEIFTRLVASRRSVRQFEPTPIPDEIVHRCIDLALLAPNSSNLQSWEFYRIKSPDVRAKMNVVFFSQPAATSCAELIICVARTGTWRKHAKQMIGLLSTQPVPPAALDYYKKLVPFVYTMGPLGIAGFFKRILFAIIGMFRPVPREPVNRGQMQTWAAKSCALACQNLMLAFRAYGYDTCSMEGYDSRKLRKLLRLPSDAVVVMGIGAGVGKPSGVYGPRIRFPREQSVFEV